MGFVVGDFLVAHFPDVLDLAFTARMEDQLAEISNGRARWRAVRREMWERLSRQVEEATLAAAGKDKIVVPGYEYTTRRRPKPKRAARPVGEKCPECGQELVERKGRHGPFIGCTGYPACKFTHKIPFEKSEQQKVAGMD